MLSAFHALQEIGLGVIDAGARGGAPATLSEIAPLVGLVAFEPDHDECERLNARPGVECFRSVSYLPYALGAARGTRSLYQCRSGGASSLLEPNRAFL